MTIRTASTPAELNTAWGASIGGDIIRLATGSYGNWTPTSQSFASDVIVEPQTNATVTFTTIVFNNTDHVQFRSANSGTITIDLNPSAGTSVSTKILNLSGGCTNITIGGSTAAEGITIKSADPATGGLGTDMRGYGYYVEGVGGANITIQNNLIQNVALSGVMFQVTDGTIEDNTCDGAASDFFRFDNVAGSSSASRFRFANNIAYNNNYSQAAPIAHPDFCQFTDTLGSSPDTGHFHITGNVFIQNAQAGIEDDPGDAADAQFIFLTNTSATVAYDDFLIEENICITSLGNGIYCQNFTNSTIQNNTVLWYPDIRVPALPGVEMLQGTATDLQSSNTIQNNIGFRFATDNGTANTFTGNTTVQWEFPHSSGGDFVPDLFLDPARYIDTRPTTPDPAGLVRHPGGGFGTKGASTREADFAPTLFIDPGFQRGTVDSLTHNFQCRVYASNDQTGLGSTDFNWDFGDGTTVSAGSPSQSHTYDNQRDGPYKVTVTRISTADTASYNTPVQSPYHMDFDFDASDFTNNAEGALPLREAYTGAWGNAGTFVTNGSGMAINIASTQYMQAANSANSVALEQAFNGLQQVTIAFDLFVANGGIVANDPIAIAGYWNFRLNTTTSIKWIMTLAGGAVFPTITLPGGSTIDDDTFHRFVLSYDGTTGTSPISAWFDGSACTISGAPASPDRFAVDTTERPLQIGVSAAGLAFKMDNPRVILGLMTAANEDTLVAGWQSGLAAGGGGGAKKRGPFLGRGVGGIGRLG